MFTIYGLSKFTFTGPHDILNVLSSPHRTWNIYMLKIPNTSSSHIRRKFNFVFNSCEARHGGRVSKNNETMNTSLISSDRCFHWRFKEVLSPCLHLKDERIVEWTHRCPDIALYLASSEEGKRERIFMLSSPWRPSQGLFRLFLSSRTREIATQVAYERRCMGLFDSLRHS